MNNTITGSGFADSLIGGIGSDTLTGGAGADKFIFEFTDDSDSFGGGTDTIIDFSFLEGDRFDLQTIDANLNLSGNQNFTYIDGAAFTAAGQVRATFSADLVTIELNNDSDLDIDMSFTASSTTAALEAWFDL